LDNLPPDRRKDLDIWLAESYEHGNRLFITSRPYVQPNINVDNRKIDCENLTILPLSLDLIEDFISNRQKNERLRKNIINKIRTIYSPLLYIPFYLDLIASLGTEDFPDDEISLFEKWLLIIENKHSDLCEKIHLAESLAFEFCFPQSKAFTKDQIKDITKDNKFYKYLERAGWIKPTDSFYHQHYTFIHDRLKEYLAGRFIWNNWDKQTLRIHDGEDCLLRFEHTNKIFEFAFLYGETLARQDNKIQDRLEVLCGELNLDKKKHIYDKLKAPFLACYIAYCLDLNDKGFEWISVVRELAIKLWKKYYTAQKEIRSKTNPIISNLYRIISNLMLFVNYRFSESDLKSNNIYSTNFLEFRKMLANSRNIPSSFYERFLIKLAEFAQLEGREQEFMWFTKRLPFNYKLKGFYYDIVTNMNSEENFLYEWADAALIFLAHYPDEFEQFYSDWSSSNDEEIMLLAVKRWFILCDYYRWNKPEKNKEIIILIAKNEYEKWLQSIFPSVRGKAIEALYKNDDILSLDVEFIFENLLEDSDYSVWFDSINSHHLRLSQPKDWSRKCRMKLRKWAYTQYPIKELDRNLYFCYNNFELLEEIKEHYDKSLTYEEAEFLARILSNRKENKMIDDFFEYLLTKFDSNEEINESYNFYKISNYNLKYIRKFSEKTDFIKRNSVEHLIYHFDEFYKEDKSLAIQVMEEFTKKEYPQSMYPIIKLLEIDDYKNKLELLEFVINNEDWRYVAIILRDVFLQTPLKINLKLYIEKLLKHENEFVRFYAICCLIYMQNLDNINDLIKNGFEDNSHFVRAAAFRVAAMMDGVEFSNTTFYYSWRFFNQQKLEFTNNYYMSDFGFENIKFNDSHQISYGISHREIKPLLKNLYEYNNDEFPSAHPLDLSLEMKCINSKKAKLPLWLKKGLEDSDQKIILAVLQYLLHYLTNLEMKNDFEELIKLLTNLSEHENIEIKDFAKSILFLVNSSIEETKAIIEFTTKIKEKSDFEQRFFVWILGKRKESIFYINT